MGKKGSGKGLTNLTALLHRLIAFSHLRKEWIGKERIREWVTRDWIVVVDPLHSGDSSWVEPRHIHVDFCRGINVHF